MLSNFVRFTIGLMALLPMTTLSAPIKTMILDGQNNHDWRSTTPVMKKHLEAAGIFTVQVVTAPANKAGMASFAPKFSDYQVVVLNYTGDDWPKPVQESFEAFVRNGGGLVIVHAADNAFPEWKAFNEMIGIGGWGGRNEKSGPYLRLRDGKFVHDMTPGPGGSHGAQRDYLVDTRVSDHPIMQGIPAGWLHVKDELYDRMRGPAVNLTVLASALADKSKGGSGEHEPVLMTISYGSGRVFHTVLGHDASSMSCVGFIATLQRGTEWAATGKVTLPLPADFPTATQTSARK